MCGHSDRLDPSAIQSRVYQNVFLKSGIKKRDALENINRLITENNFSKTKHYADSDGKLEKIKLI